MLLVEEMQYLQAECEVLKWMKCRGHSMLLSIPIYPALSSILQSSNLPSLLILSNLVDYDIDDPRVGVDDRVVAAKRVW